MENVWFPSRYIPLHIFAPGVSAVASCRKVLGMPVVLLISFCLNLPLRRVQINIIKFFMIVLHHSNKWINKSIIYQYSEIKDNKHSVEFSSTCIFRNTWQQNIFWKTSFLLDKTILYSFLKLNNLFVTSRKRNHEFTKSWI